MGIIVDVFENDPIIIDGEELKHDQEEDIVVMQECDRCGADDVALYAVDDSDPDVGYYDVIRVCGDCLQRKGRR
jgi:hypothetical protein